MATFRLTSVHESSTDLQVAFNEQHTSYSRSLGAFLSKDGRLFAVRYEGRWLHHRGMRGPGGKRVRMDPTVFRQVRDAASAAIATKAMGFELDKFPLQEIDL